jgi:hypothetical protein
MILLMIVCDLNIIRVAIAPFKANTPLVIYAYAVLTFPVTFQSLFWYLSDEQYA